MRLGNSAGDRPIETLGIQVRSPFKICSISSFQNILYFCIVQLADEYFREQSIFGKFQRECRYVVEERSQFLSYSRDRPENRCISAYSFVRTTLHYASITYPEFLGIAPKSGTCFEDALAEGLPTTIKCF